MGDTNDSAQTVSSPRTTRPGLLAVSGALILTPVTLGLAVPLYQRTDPTLIGIPFFYWFQMAMAVLAAMSTGTVYWLLFTGEEDGEAGA